MNWVDLVIVLVVIFFAFESYAKPLISETLDLISFILAFLLSLKFYNFAGRFLETTFSLPHSLSNVLGFVIVWYLIETLVLLVSDPIVNNRLLSKNRLHQTVLSLVPGALKGLIFVAIILIVVATFPIQPKIKSTVLASKIGSKILDRSYQLEQPLKSIFGGLENDTLTFMTVEPKTNESIDLGFKTSNFSFDSQKEMAMIDLVNNERRNRGIKTLTFDAKLREVARSHSGDMFQRGYFSHYSPEGETIVNRASKVGVLYNVIGENLAFAPTLETAHNGLMNSPGHRANILSTDFNKIGIGIANSSDYGLMITQVFTN